jgi:8-oxo-dGTP diphosphatase
MGRPPDGAFVSDDRSYPSRPILAVSAAIFRDGRLCVVRRARKPALGVFTLPGGVVELGETLIEAVCREVREETSLEIAPLALAGHRDVIIREAERVHRHFVVLPFAARWIAGEVHLNEELAEFRWIAPGELAQLETTEGLADIVTTAMNIIGGTDG